jgi:rubrerythrin
MNPMIEKLARHEETVSALYNEYAKRFPTHREFFSKLTKDELDHAQKIRMLGIEINNGRAVFYPTNYNAAAVDSSLTYVIQQTDIARSGDLVLINALSVALSIEKSIIDGKFFDAFKGFFADTRRIIRELSDAVNDHYREVQDLWDKQRRYS